MPLFISATVAMPLALAETTHATEDWENYLTTGEFCTVNIGTQWTCSGTPDAAFETRAAILGGERVGEVKVLYILASALGSSSAPNMYTEFTAPTADYKAETEWDLFDAQSATNGAYVLLRLSDVNGTKILEIGMNDADDVLDVSNGTSWEETSYTIPTAFRNYQVSVDIDSKTCDLKVFNGATEVFSKTGINVVSSSDARAVRLTVGSMSTSDASVGGYWDHLRVFTP